MGNISVITGETARESLMKYSCSDACKVYFAYKGSQSYLLSGIRTQWIKHRIPLSEVWYDRGILAQCETLIIFDTGISLEYLKWIKLHSSAKRLLFYYWNIYRSGKVHPDEVRNLGYEIWSFDPNDCDKYCMQYNPQMFFRSWYEDLSEARKMDPIYDVVFVGRDQYGRMQKMQEIIELFEKLNISYHLYFVAEKWYQRFASPRYGGYLDFRSMVKEELKGKVILDFTAVTQKGFTLRIYDALCNNRKVITNNDGIKQMEFYSKENIFILGEDDDASLYDFVYGQFEPINKLTLEHYSVEGWLKRFEKAQEL